MHLDFQAAIGNECSVEASSPKLAELIAGLDSLHDGLSYVNRLIAYGPAAIPRLREILIERAPSAIPEPRQWAVLALAGLGPGVVEALASFHRFEPAPYLIQYLEDDVCRQSVLDALEALGEQPRALLLESAVTPSPPPPEWETPSSVRRRRCSLQLLERIPLPADEIQQLIPLLSHSDPEIVVRAISIATQSNQLEGRATLAFHLRRIANRVPWWLQSEFTTLKSKLESWTSLP